MKPHLIDKKYILPLSKPIIKKQIPVISQNKSNFNLYIHLSCIFIIIMGIYFLYIRKNNKELNKMMYDHKIKQMYHDIDILDKKLQK
jgi:hypothetical protein